MCECRYGKYTRVVLWESDVGALVQGMCYKLKGAGVCCYDGVKYLAVGKKCEL